MARSQDSSVYAGCAKLQEKVIGSVAALKGCVGHSRTTMVPWLTLAAAGLTIGVAVAASLVVVDTTDVRLRIVRSEFENGFDSGWHTHPGPVIVQVQEGTFKIYQGGCEPIVVHAGESYIEVPLVPVRAVAKGRIIWTTSQILPAEFPAQDPAVPPCQ